jgi:hypothetical protein
MQDDVVGAVAQFGAVVAEAAAAHDDLVTLGDGISALAALAAGDVAAARESSEATWQHLSVTHPQLAAVQRAHHATQVALTGGDLIAARRWADDAVAVATGWRLVVARSSKVSQ